MGKVNNDKVIGAANNLSPEQSKELDALEMQAFEAAAWTPQSTKIRNSSRMGGVDVEPRNQHGNSTLYGEYRINRENSYIKYDQLSMITPHVFIPLLKLGISLSSGMEIEGKVKKNVKKMQDWAEKVNFFNVAKDIGTCMVRDGTTVVYLPKTQDKDNGVQGIKNVEILPMRYATLLPEGREMGDEGKTLLKGEVTQAVLNEKVNRAPSNDGEKGQPYKRDEIGLFRLFHAGNFMLDVLGRETYSMYGVSLLESIDRPLKNYMDIVDGYASYMRRYGVGRLFIDVPLVAKLRSEGRYEEAKNILQGIIARQRNLKPNEDIVGGGIDAKTLSSGNMPDARDLKESLETDIHVGLLQSPVTMGKTSGSTYASAYTSEEDRFFVLGVIQELFVNTLQQEIIERQARLMGIDPKSVWLTVNRLDIPKIDPRLMLDATDSGYVSETELRERSLGLNPEKPYDDIPENTPVKTPVKNQEKNEEPPANE